MSESDGSVAPDQLTSLISVEVERQLRERGSVLEAMKEQMAKVLAEFEDMAANVSSKRSWSNSVTKSTKPIVSPKKTSPFGVHPVVTPLDIVPPAASSPPKLPKIGGGLLKSIHQFQGNASGGALPPANAGPRSPDGKITFDKILPRVANIEKRADGSQIMLSQQKQHIMYDDGETPRSDASAALQAPRASLELDFVYGCRSGTTTSLSSSHPAAPNASTNNSAFYLPTGEVMWFTATLVVLYKKETNTQRYFREHTNEVTSVAVHPNQRIVASGQAGRSAFLLVWNASDELLGKRFACLKGHQVAVRSISFSHDGKLIASLGGDMYNTICIHDWKAQELLVSARGHTFRVHAVAFNPFQAYGRPEAHRSKKPGQALNDDDACYTMVSCGVRHIRFWTLTKADYVPPPSKENADSAFSRSTFGGPPRLRPPTPTEKVWKLEGNVPSFHGRFEVQDFTSLTFVNDSPPVYVYDEHSKELTATNATDHSLGRIIAGTAKGDLCLFLQPRASPDVHESDLRKEPAKWWEVPDEFTDAEINELVLEKIAYEPTGRLVDIVPHDQETGNRFKVPRQAQAEMEGLSKKMALRPKSTALHFRWDELKYSGPLAHQGAAYQVAYSKKLNMIMSCGNDGKLLLWTCQMSKPMRIPGVNTQGVFTPLTGTFAEGSHALLPFDDPTKVFQLPTVLPNEISAGGTAATPKPTSIVWKDDGNFVLVATSNSCVWELNTVSGEWQLLFEARSGAVAVCAAHPAKEEVVTVSQDGYLSFWDLERRVCTRRLYLGSFITSGVKAFCMEFHPAGHELAIGLSSGELLVVDCDSLKVMLRKSTKSISGSTTNLHIGLSGPGFRAIAQVKYCPNAKYLAVGVKDTFVYIYDVINGYKKLHVCDGHSSAVVHLTWNKDGDILQSNAADSEILHWLVSPTKGETKQITDAFLVRDVQWIKWTCVFGWPTPGIWSEESPNLVDIAAVSATGPKRLNEVGDSRNPHSTSSEDMLAVACRSSVHLLKNPAPRGAKRKVYKAHSSAITTLSFSFDDAYLVTVGGDDGTLMQWKVVSRDASSTQVGVNSSTRKTHRVQLTEDDSIGEQWPSTSPVPPAQDDTKRSSQLSPRQQSRQYRERPVYQDDGDQNPRSGQIHSAEQEAGPDRESLQQTVNDEDATIDSPEGERHRGASDSPAERGTSYRDTADAGDPLPSPIQVRATHVYAAENSDELSLNRGEILRVLSKAGDGDWWLGETCDGTKGYFPATFVEEVDLSAPVTGGDSIANEEQLVEAIM
ncbi:Cilia- and flagella-associated protein 44 [Phytophthora pseudosyringae]|uniref:Cilia- and flagella-associated protein 44 n=1 Tax=Phytophthora pseudosyringae TaxID=221518 RepID=A0A8T1WM48_9STRA|nr:Cilia- and flagella-associated protein 44 [Phytophthora pseudosyringae]